VSRFVRQETPPQFDECTKYLPFLRRDFRYRCAYCERTETFLGGEEFFEIDHFRPVWRFLEQVTHYPNLYYSCSKCNRHKGKTWPSDEEISSGFRFADPCQEDMYVEHFQEMPDGQLQPLNNCGRYTGEHIRLNRRNCSRGASSGARWPRIYKRSRVRRAVWKLGSWPSSILATRVRSERKSRR